MTQITQGAAIRNHKTQVWKVGKTIKVMGVQISTALAAVLTDKVVAHEDGLSPFVVLAALANQIVRWGYAALPLSVRFASIIRLADLRETVAILRAIFAIAETREDFKLNAALRTGFQNMLNFFILLIGPSSLPFIKAGFPTEDASRMFRVVDLGLAMSAEFNHSVILR